MEFMLDTNICIYLINKQPIKIIKKLKSIKTSDICISSITSSELWFGVYKSSYPKQNSLALTEFLSSINTVNFNDEAAINYGQIRAHLEKKGKIIGAMDMLIGAHALAMNLTLVTNNIREFKRIPDLKVINWV